MSADRGRTGQQVALEQLLAGHGLSWISDHTGLTEAEVAQVAAGARLARVPGTDRFAPPGDPAPPARPRLTSVPDPLEPAMQPAQTLAQRAALTGDPKVLALHAKAKDAQERLRAAVEAWEAKSDARRRVAELEAQLADARAALRGGKAKAAPPAGDSKAVRAWAAANGVDCPASGMVPGRVRAAYEEAQR